MSPPRRARLKRGGAQNSSPLSAPGLVGHFFRHEYGRLVAILVRRSGPQHLADIEDAVQSALMTALREWPIGGRPDNPTAWLFRVAWRNLLGELRRNSGRRRLRERNAAELAPADTGEPTAPPDDEIADDLLRMLIVCCDDAIPPDSQLAIALKTLCGFDVREISLRLFTTEANIYKRLERARERLRETPPCMDEFTAAHYSKRRPGVLRILYALFTEGYLSAHPETAIRRELCDEAIRLATILAGHPAGRTPDTCALLALMHLHVARTGARQDAAGGLLLLEEQDRSRWDREQIALGLQWLAQSAEGDSFSRYHAEAAIAAEHCRAPSFKETQWQRVAECYALLEQLEPSAIHRLNRAVAVAEWQGPAAGLAVIENFVPPTWLAGSYLWAATLSDLQRRCGHAQLADRHRATALRLAPTPAIASALRRRLTST